MAFEGLTPTKKLTLKDLLSERPVQGIGYERFSEQESKDIDALLSGFGSSLDDPLLEGLQGSELADMMEYVRAPVGSPERAQKAETIHLAIKRLRDNA